MVIIGSGGAFAAGADIKEMQPNDYMVVYRLGQIRKPTVAAVSGYALGENPDLVHVLTELKGPKVDVFFVYPEELRNSKRVAVFRDFLLARLAEMH